MSARSQTILVVDDEASLARNIARFLEREGYTARAVFSAEEALGVIEDLQPDFVLTDLRLPDMSGTELLRELKTLLPGRPSAVMTAHSDMESAVEAMRTGANDYLVKPLILRDVERLVTRTFDEQRRRQRLEYFERREPGREGLAGIVGRSPAVIELKSMIERVVESDRRLTDRPGAPVMIAGETGSGKELVARALHFAGPRSAQPFIELNCSTLPAHLVESELFGHEKGAFTDATDRRIGLVEAADGGTLFLDEIGEIGPEVQVKLLKLLEDRRVRRIGSTRDREVDVRIVAATNQHLETMVAEGRFRSDLYFRIRIIQINVPPLRACDDDVLILAEHFLAEVRRRYRRPGLGFSPRAVRALKSHSWPGNVRELKNAIEQASVVARGDTLEPEDLWLSTISLPFGDASGAQLGELPEGGLDLEALERSLMQQALERANGNVTAAARLLRLSRDTMRYRIEKFGLQA